MIDLSLADSLKDEGNYIQANKLYQQILLSGIDLREKADLNYKIKAVKNYYKSVSNISVGEVFFPVINGASLRGIVLTGKVSLTTNNKLSSEQSERWEKVKALTFDFLDKYLYDKIKTVMILDWGQNDYKFFINQIPNSTLNLDELVSGSSIELAMFISLISFVLNKNIGNKFAFTGQVLDDFSIGYVVDTAKKDQVITIERPMVKKFIIPPKTKTKGIIQQETNTLEELVKKIFPDIDKILIENQKELGKRRLTLKKLKIRNDKKGSIDYADFEFGDQNNIEEDEGENVYSFLQNNIFSFKNCSNGLIISGLRINYSAPMLTIPLYNHTPRFLALRYTRASNLATNEGAAYIVLSNDNNYQPGTMIKFNLPFGCI